MGGAAESLESFPGRYRLVLRKRKGFIRIALQTGNLFFINKQLNL